MAWHFCGGRPWVCIRTQGEEKVTTSYITTNSIYFLIKKKKNTWLSILYSIGLYKCGNMILLLVYFYVRLQNQSWPLRDNWIPTVHPCFLFVQEVTNASYFGNDYVYLFLVNISVFKNCKFYSPKEFIHFKHLTHSWIHKTAHTCYSSFTLHNAFKRFWIGCCYRLTYGSITAPAEPSSFSSRSFIVVD